MRDILIDESTEYLFLQYQDDSLEIYDIAQKQYVPFYSLEELVQQITKE